MEKGYPQIVLDTMDEDTKMDIYNEGDIAFCGAVITYYDENSGTYSEIDVNEDGTYIAPRGQISTSDLSLSFTYSRSPAAKNTKLSYIKVTTIITGLIFRFSAGKTLLLFHGMTANFR